MVTATTAHPPADKLAAYGLGRLDDAQSAEIEAHLAVCTECQQVLEDTPADSLVETLREPAPVLAPHAVESPPGLFARLAAVLNPQAARSHQDVPAELRDLRRPSLGS